MTRLFKHAGLMQSHVRLKVDIQAETLPFRHLTLNFPLDPVSKNKTQLWFSTHQCSCKLARIKAAAFSAETPTGLPAKKPTMKEKEKKADK